MRVAPFELPVAVHDTKDALDPQPSPSFRLCCNEQGDPVSCPLSGAYLDA